MWEKKIKKTVFVLNVDNYAPEITKLTYPILKRYAQKIGADFFEITERKNPKYSPVYEKLQIFDLAKKMENDWNIYFDSDALVHPDMMDITEFISKDTICQNTADLANNRWRYDDYFRRDGRHIGTAGWFTVASNWCIDLWHPLTDMTYEEALKNIFPTQKEINGGMEVGHFIDDYILSRNVARYGLKYTTFSKIKEEVKDSGEYLWHTYNVPNELKIEQMKNVLSNWGLTGYKDPNIPGRAPFQTLSWLYLRAQEMDSVVEIGSWLGKTTHALLSGCKGNVYSVDDFREATSIFFDVSREAAPADIAKAEDFFKQNVAGFKNSVFMRTDSQTAATKFEDNSVDMVFLDGSTGYDAVSRDIQSWFPKCKKMLCGTGADLASVQGAVLDNKLNPMAGPNNLWYVIKR